MRIYTEGFETRDLNLSNAILINVFYTSSTGGITPRKDVNGNGGNYFISSNIIELNNYFITQNEFDICNLTGIRPKEIWLRAAFFNGDPSRRFSMLFLNRFGEYQISWRTDTSGRVVLYRGYAYSGGTVLATSTSPIPAGRWVLFELHAYIDDTNGFFRIYLDGSDTAFVEANNTDTNPNSIEPGISRIGLTVPLGGGWDDLAINSITMLYDGGSGSAPTLGSTITGGTSGATAIVTGYEGDATSGRLWLENVNLDPNPFQDNETISGSGFSALVNAPTASFISGLEPQSTRIGDGHVIILRPNGDDTIQLNGSDGNQIDNYALVNDPAGAPNESNYVETSTANNGDLYHLQSFSDAGFGSGQVAGVNAVEVVAWAKRSGASIPNIELAVKSNMTTDYGDKIALPFSYDTCSWHWSYNPDDNANWEEADINSLIIGMRFNT